MNRNGDRVGRLEPALRHAALLAMLLAMLLAALPARAGQERFSRWRFYSSQDGLAESWSSFISVGPTGRVWVSHGEVERLSCLTGWPGPDGRLVQSMPSSGHDWKALESACGQLWSLSESGLQLYREDGWKTFRIEEINNLSPPDAILPELELVPFLPGERDQCYYLLPDRLQLFRADEGRIDTILTAAEAGLGRLSGMAAARGGGLWITGERGAARLTFQGGTGSPRLTRFPVTMPGVRDLDQPVEGEDGRLLTIAARGMENVLLVLEGGVWQVLLTSREPISRAWFSQENCYWVVRGKNDLTMLEQGREVLQDKVGILAGDFFDAAVEPGGVFWISTSHGVARYAPALWSTPRELSDCQERVHAIHEDARGRLWFGAVHQLISCDNGRWRRYRLPDGLETQSYFTRSLASLPDGRIAVGTLPYQSSLLIFDPGSERFERIPYRGPDSLTTDAGRMIGLISPLAGGQLLVQTFDRLNQADYRLELFDGKVFHPLLSLEGDGGLGNLRYAFRAGDGELWLGGQTERALAVLGETGLRDFLADSSYAGTGGFCIGEVDGRIWVGGRDKLLEYDGRGWSEVLAGLSSVRSIMAGRDGSVWVASGTGLHRRFEDSWVTYTAEDGLPNSAVFDVLEDSRGRIWAGTVSGVALYNPSADLDPPEAILPERRNPRETPPGSEVRLIFTGEDKWQQSRADRLLFSWRLDQGRWSPFVPGSVAFYRGLAPGLHRFEVRAMDSNLNVDREPAAFEFTVLLPWYQEPGFKLLAVSAAVVILLLLGYAIYRHINLERLVIERTADLRRTNRRLEEKIAELERAEATLKDSQKLELIGRIASGVAHEVRNPLNSILAITEALFLELGDGAEFRPYLDNIRLQVDRLAMLMNDLLELGKPIERSSFSRTSLLEVCDGAVELWQRSCPDPRRRVAVLRPQGEVDTAVIGNVPKLQQVFFNLLENAAQHSPPDSEVTITLIRRPEQVVALVRDQGQGIRPEHLPELFKPFFSTRSRGAGLGLSIVRNIVELHGGRVRVLNNDPPPGATVEVELPPAGPEPAAEDDLPPMGPGPAVEGEA